MRRECRSVLTNHPFAAGFSSFLPSALQTLLLDGNEGMETVPPEVYQDLLVATQTRNAKSLYYEGQSMRPVPAVHWSCSCSALPATPKKGKLVDIDLFNHHTFSWLLCSEGPCWDEGDVVKIRGLEKTREVSVARTRDALRPSCRARTSPRCLHRKRKWALLVTDAQYAGASSTTVVVGRPRGSHFSNQGKGRS